MLFSGRFSYFTQSETTCCRSKDAAMVQSEALYCFYRESGKLEIDFFLCVLL